MADYWDNVEILKAIDTWQQETYKGGPLQSIDGLYLMQRLTGAFHQVDRMRGFVQELHICAAAGLLEFEVRHDPYRPNLADADPSGPSRSPGKTTAARSAISSCARLPNPSPTSTPTTTG
jgi:hypothetical protein